MKKWIFLTVIALGLICIVSCGKDAQQENDNLAIQIKKMDTKATGKDGGSSTGDKNGDG